MDRTQCKFGVVLQCSYKHALDGMARVAKEEGITKLFNGANWATGRAVSEQEHQPNQPMYN